MKKIKILFITNMPITDFIKVDLDILENYFNVVPYRWTGIKDLKNVLLVLWYILKTDLSFIWFAGGHAAFVIFFSKLFKKKTIVVVGGYEVAIVPEIGYGALLNPKSAKKVKYALKNADLILTVDNDLRKDAIRNVGIDCKNIITLPTGYDPEKWKFHGKKEYLVLTIALGSSWGRVRVKGLDTFVASAKFLPDVKFLVIGIQEDVLSKLQSIASSNVMLISPIPQKMLLQYYQKAKVYCQLSIREGLPNALCEAMLCECVPVGTNVQGVRTAIGNTGFYVPYGNPEATAEAIKKALESNKGKKARKRIERIFFIDKREEKLIELIRGLIND